jgi:hypothetical protein
MDRHGAFGATVVPRCGYEGEREVNLAILIQTFSPYSVARAIVGSVGEGIPEETSHA